MRASDSPVDVVEAYYRYVDAEDYDALVALFADDIVYHRPGHDPLEGIADFERFYHEVRDLTEGTHELHDVIADGSRVAVRGSFTGLQGETPISLSFADFFGFGDDGRIRTRYTFTDQGQV